MSKAITTKPVRVEIPWRTGNYLGRITGPSERYGLQLEWETGTPVKSRGVVKFDLRPGWYAARETYDKSRGGPTAYYRVDTIAATPVPEHLAEYLADAATGPSPGEPGEWAGLVCRCGEDVAGYTGRGFPWCDDCNTGGEES